MNQPITLTEFNNLPNPEKYTLLEDYGVYLDVYRMQGKMKIALFNLDGMYIEVYLNQLSDQLIGAIAFDSYEMLDPYITSIDMRAVFAER